MNNIAIITFTESSVTPVEVEFPHGIGHYRTVEDALKDIAYFNCILMPY